MTEGPGGTILARDIERMSARCQWHSVGMDQRNRALQLLEKYAYAASDYCNRYSYCICCGSDEGAEHTDTCALAQLLAEVGMLDRGDR